MYPRSTRRRHVHAAVGGLALALLIAACSPRPTDSRAAASPPASQARPAPAAPSAPTIARPTLADSAPRDLPGLHNVVAYAPGVYSGGMPENPEAFETLKALGVRTVISVDGAIPDAASAKARGLRYIHLPIGYHGIDAHRALELARALRDTRPDGPVYIHCHHGKHRSAAAAAVALASLGLASPDAMHARMKVSGTAAGYTGLWACAADTSPASAADLDSVGPDFPEAARPGGFVQSMVEIDEALEHLREIQRADWRTPDSHPDLVPAAEAGRLADLLRHALETDYSPIRRHLAAGADDKSPLDQFRQLMLDNAAKAADLERLLTARSATLSADAATRRDSLAAALAKVIASCSACHKTFRD